MEYSIKEELHKLIDTCQEEAVLYEIKERLSGNEKDWWDELTEEEQEEILETTKRVDAGIKFSDEHAQNIFKKWLEK